MLPPRDLTVKAIDFKEVTLQWQAPRDKMPHKIVSTTKVHSKLESSVIHRP